MAADIYLCMYPLNMQFQIISKECKNSAVLHTKDLFPKRFGVWLTQNMTFGRKPFIVWSIPISEQEYKALGFKIHLIKTDAYQLLLSSSNKNSTKLILSQKHDSTTKPWQVVAGWQIQEVPPTELQKHPQRDYGKTLENQVSSRLNQEAAAPRTTEFSIKCLFSWKTRNLAGAGGRGAPNQNCQISDSWLNYVRFCYD